ncbi:MAG: NAD-dependent malic enzyme [Chloroflexi bacterium SZAS-1]|nr:NAD-dependent malic enzyme [Chloroflexi bacterium SZAS-1]HNP84593.1 NAD-dependent malic enzyme [Kouleothrix sp.]
MKAYHVVQNPHSGETTIETPLDGALLLECPMINKGSAFTEAERQELGLLGLLPPHVASIEEQLVRTYENYRQKPNAQERHVFLTSLQDRNEALFYRLLSEHLPEMLPMVYAPVIGITAQHYSHSYRRPRGLYIAYPQRDAIEAILRNAPTDDIRAIVVTDGEHVVGLGDMGVGGMEIAVGKLTLYTLCAGIHPAHTLPIHLDVGTDNQALLDDPLYLGWRHERVRGPEYDAFIELFVDAVTRVFPNAILQWEDFARPNARRLLDRYRDRICSFNDDIQGTGAATLAGVLAGLAHTGNTIAEQRVVIAGAGAVASGVADMLAAAMIQAGVAPDEARAAIWLIDSHGPLHQGRSDLDATKQQYAQPLGSAVKYRLARPVGTSLAEVVQQLQPTMLIGASGQSGLFTREVVESIAGKVERPLIFPLSSPLARAEAVPGHLLEWTNGRAVVVTSTSLPDVVYRNDAVTPSQLSSLFIFPGVALGAIAAGARRITEPMLVAAAQALSHFAPLNTRATAPLYPTIANVREVARAVGIAVATAAEQAGVSTASGNSSAAERVDARMWQPAYNQIRHVE